MFNKAKKILEGIRKQYIFEVDQICGKSTPIFACYTISKYYIMFINARVIIITK